MSKFFLSIFFSFLLAKASALNLILKEADFNDGLLGTVLSFFSGILNIIEIDNLPVFDVLELPTQESTVIINTLITYTPIFYFFILFGWSGLRILGFLLKFGRRN